MKSKLIVITASALMLAAALVVSVAQEQEQDEQVRGSFLSTRKSAVKVASNSNSSRGNSNRGRKPPKNSNSSSRANSNQATTANTGAAVNVAADRIGLGYTLFIRNQNGDPVRVDPLTVFHAGDRIRIALETNAAGYLYIFHTENDGPPTMIFPDIRLEGGDNQVEAHVPFEAPSSTERDERFRWFAFDQTAATERVYIVISREPLAGVPYGDELNKLCAGTPSACPWRPSAEIWSQLMALERAKAGVSKSAAYGQQQTAYEREAITRGLGLDATQPAPSVIRMNVSADSRVLVTVIELVHK